MQSDDQQVALTYEAMLRSGASDAVAIERALSIYRESHPTSDDYTVRTAVAHIVAEVRVRMAKEKKVRTKQG